MEHSRSRYGRLDRQEPADYGGSIAEEVQCTYAMSATAMTIGSETTEAMEVTIVSVLKVP